MMKKQNNKSSFLVSQSIKELQSSLRDGVILFRALLEELRRNMEAERDGIMTTYAKLIDSLKKQYEILIKDLERWDDTDDSSVVN